MMDVSVNHHHIHDCYCRNKLRRAASSSLCAAQESCPCAKLQTAQLPEYEQKEENC